MLEGSESDSVRELGRLPVGEERTGQFAGGAEKEAMDKVANGQ